MGIASLSNSGREKTGLLKVIKKLYVGKVCQCLTHALGKAEQGLPGRALIRAFQTEPSLLFFRPDRPLGEGYEMEPEGKSCTTGRPRLSRQLRPPQEVNYSRRQPGVLEDVFWMRHRNEHSLPSRALDPQQITRPDPGKAPPERRRWSVVQQRLRGAMWPSGPCPQQRPIVLPTNHSQVGFTTAWSSPHFSRTPHSHPVTPISL